MKAIKFAQAAAVLLVAVSPVLHAAPFTPASESEIVQRLPAGWDAKARRQQAALMRDPAQLPLALAAARAAIDRARQTGDPREWGLAQAALGTWWALDRPPAAVRLLRAVIWQGQHAFAAAQADLALLASEGTTPLPLQAQAQLTLASVLQVTGRLADAVKACEVLLEPRFAPLGAAVELPARACLAELRSLQGDPRQADAELAALARQAPADRWLALLRAELAHRRGDAVAARARFQEALAGSPDVYTRAAHADWLLDQARPREALAALEPDGEASADHDAGDSDALLLRRAIALRQLSSPEADAAAAMLAARFAAARARGNSGLHLREEARFALDVQNDSPRALQLAQLNWQQQREPADAVLLLRAALRAGEPAAAEVLRQWLPDPARADVRLAAMRNRSAR